MDEIEEVKSRTDLVELVGSYVQIKKAGANYKATCPFHQEKTASLMVSPQKQIWKCFGCGKGGDAFKFVMETEHLEFGDALRMLAKKANVTLKPKTDAEFQSQSRKDRLFRVNALSAKIFEKILWEHPQGKLALDYLKKRGLSEETIKKFNLGLASRAMNVRNLMLQKGVLSGDLSAAGNPEKFFDRIMFPIQDVLGNVVGFTGRALGDAQPKYLNTPETQVYSKSRVLYGLNHAKKTIVEKDQVILVEGQMDVVALHQAGITNAVASSGTAITETQLMILSKYTQNFLLAFDSDEAGQATTRKVIEMLLKLDLNSRVVSFLPYKDAGEMFEKDPTSWPKTLSEAAEGFDWCLEREVQRNVPLSFIENKKKVIKALLPVVALIIDPTRLDYVINHLSKVLEVRPESLYESLKKYQHPEQAASQGDTKQSRTSNLTAEEQLLALVLGYPTILDAGLKSFDEIVWQSVEAKEIADSVKTCYNDKALVKNQSLFSSKVKNSIKTQAADKIDSWQFWLTSTWPEINDKLALDLYEDKIQLLSNKKREAEKENLALKIRQAQEKNDIEAIKKLMQQLTKMAQDVSKGEEAK